MTLFSLMWFCVTVCLIQGTFGDGLIEVFQWKQIDFNIGMTNVRPKDKIIFPGQFNSYRNKRDATKKTSRDNPTGTDSRWTPHSASGSTQSLNQNNYIPYNNVPMGVTHARGKMFITVPRRRPGVPATLNTIDMRNSIGNPSPKLTPYPNLATNELNSNFQADPNRIISVYRTSVDVCQRLWFIDTGMLEYPDNRVQVQRPSIWILGLRDDRLIRRFEIPESIVETGQGLASLTIDVEGMNCDKAFAYIPDLLNDALYVYSFENNRIWAFSHNYFNFDPIAGDLFVGGQSFRWDDGIFSITLGPFDATGNRTVFFHPMASNNEFIVSNAVLKNEANAGRSSHGRDFQLLGSRGRNRQSTMHEYDPRTGVLFYAEIQRNGVGCWNTNTQFSAENHGTVAQDEQRMIYPSDLSIDEDGVIWVMTNSMPIFIYSNLDPNTVNFRVWKQTVPQAIQNTICNQYH